MDGFQRLFSILIPWALVALCLLSCGKESTTLQGDFAPRPNIAVTPYPLFDFGSVFVGNSKRQVFTLSNIGALTAEHLASSFDLSINFQFEGGNFPGTGGTCGTELAPQQTCTAVILFVPQYSGSFSDTVRINYENGNSDWVTDSPLLLGKGI